MSRKPKSREAIVLAIDCRKSMSLRKCLNSDQSVFELSKQCIKNIIRQKVFAETKNEYLLVEFFTKSFRGLTINGRLSSPNLNSQNFTDLFKYISNQLEVVKDGQQLDFMDTLDAIIDELIDQTRGQLFSALKVAVFTSFDGLQESDLIRFRTDISRKLQQNSIQLIIICDFTPNTKSEWKLSKTQSLALELMNDIEKHSVGFCYDLNTALQTFNVFEVKKTTPSAQYSKLELGKDLNAINIPIVCYTKATVYQRKKPKTETSSVDPIHNSSINPVKPSEYPNVKALTPQTIPSQSASTSAVTQKEVLIRGFPYGQTFVPFNEENKQLFSYESKEKGLKIIGFTSVLNIDFSQRVGSRTSYVLPDGRPKQNNHKFIFQALVKAMNDQQKVAIVRYQYSERSNPQMGYLFPHSEDNSLMLAYIQLPFAEDFSGYRFPSLKSNPNHCPTENQLEVIDNLIDSMDLMNAKVDDEDINCEALKSHEIPDPTHQYWYQCSYERHLNPFVDLPEMSEDLRKSIDVPKMLSQKVVKLLKQISDNFILESPKDKSPRKRNQTIDKSSQSLTELKRQKN